MKEKIYSFEDLPDVGCIEMELSYSYSYYPGKWCGLPEDCYPSEEEIVVELPKNYKQIIRDAYLLAAEEAIKEIEGIVQDMQIDGDEVREWSVDDEMS